MNEDERYYEVRLIETSNDPQAFITAAMCDCMCCGRVLSGMGGGGKFLCQKCLDKMHNGGMAEALYLLEKQRLDHHAHDDF